MGTNTSLLTSFQTFFTFDKNQGDEMDVDTIWEDIVRTIPTLSDKLETNLALKKEIINFFSNEEFVNHFTTKYNCTVKDLVLVFIKKQFYAFDKYVVKRLISIM